MVLFLIPTLTQGLKTAASPRNGKLYLQFANIKDQRGGNVPQATMCHRCPNSEALFPPKHAHGPLQHRDEQPRSSRAPKVIFSRCCLVAIDMQHRAAAGEMLLSAALSARPSHLSSSSFIRGKQQDGRVHLRLIVGLLLLTNPAHCWRNKEETKQERSEKCSWARSDSKALRHWEIITLDLQIKAFLGRERACWPRHPDKKRWRKSACACVRERKGARLKTSH